MCQDPSMRGAVLYFYTMSMSNSFRNWKYLLSKWGNKYTFNCPIHSKSKFNKLLSPKLFLYFLLSSITHFVHTLPLIFNLFISISVLFHNTWSYCVFKSFSITSTLFLLLISQKWRILSKEGVFELFWQSRDKICYRKNTFIFCVRCRGIKMQTYSFKVNLK